MFPLLFVSPSSTLLPSLLAVTSSSCCSIRKASTPGTSWISSLWELAWTVFAFSHFFSSPSLFSFSSRNQNVRTQARGLEPFRGEHPVLFGPLAGVRGLVLRHDGFGFEPSRHVHASRQGVDQRATDGPSAIFLCLREFKKRGGGENEREEENGLERENERKKRKGNRTTKTKNKKVCLLLQRLLYN